MSIHFQKSYLVFSQYLDSQYLTSRINQLALDTSQLRALESNRALIRSSCLLWRACYQLELSLSLGSQLSSLSYIIFLLGSFLAYPKNKQYIPFHCLLCLLRQLAYLLAKFVVNDSLVSRVTQTYDNHHRHGRVLKSTIYRIPLKSLEIFFDVRAAAGQRGCDQSMQENVT